MIERFARVPLGNGPTPFQPMPALAASLGLARVWVKRDDCTGLAFGGNKTRKLEFTLADALAKGATRLVTSGGLQSNHVRQTAAAAARCGLACDVVLYDPQVSPSSLYARSGNVLIDELLGACIHYVADSGPATDARVARLMDEAREMGQTPYFVPVGASDGIGSLGYVVCAQELVADFRAAGIEPSHLFLSTGSAGTHAGLITGLRLLGSPVPVVGISSSEPSEVKRGKVRAICGQLARTLELDVSPVAEADIVVHDAYVGAGYGAPTPESRDALYRLARCEGLLLDPVYTAKAMAGMIDLISTGALGAVRDPVFLHTGGAPALFAYGDLLGEDAA